MRPCTRRRATTIQSITISRLFRRLALPPANSSDQRTRDRRRRLAHVWRMLLTEADRHIAGACLPKMQGLHPFAWRCWRVSDAKLRITRSVVSRPVRDVSPAIADIPALPALEYSAALHDR